MKHELIKGLKRIRLSPFYHIASETKLFMQSRGVQPVRFLPVVRGFETFEWKSLLEII